MTKERKRCPSTCARKIAHPTKAAAERHLAVLKAHNPYEGHLKTYRCTVCRRWFIGHARRRRKK